MGPRLTSWRDRARQEARPHPGSHRASNREWITQQARNLIMDLGEHAHRAKFMIRDCGSNFTAAFDAALAGAGIRTVLCNVQTPRMNATAERWIGGCRREFLAAGRLSGVQHLSAGYRPQAEARADTPAGREVSGCQSAATLFLTCYRGRRTTSRSTPGSSTGHIRSSRRTSGYAGQPWPGHVICSSPPLPRCSVPRPREPAIISVCGHGRHSSGPAADINPYDAIPAHRVGYSMAAHGQGSSARQLS